MKYTKFSVLGAEIMSKYYFHLYMFLYFPNFLQKVCNTDISGKKKDY